MTELEPHAWDDASHRAEIHRAADRFWTAWQLRPATSRQAHVHFMQLTRLINEAQRRKLQHDREQVA